MKFNHKVAIILVVSFILKLGFHIFYPTVIEDDAVGYLHIANSLTSGEGFIDVDGKPTIFRGPIYPFFLAGIFLLFGETYILVFILQSLMTCLSGYIIFLIARNIFDEKTALLGLGLVVFYMPFTLYEHFIYLDIMLTLFLVIVYYLLFLSAGSLKPGEAVLVGVATGIATLLKSVLLLLPPLYGIYLLISKGVNKKTLTFSILYLAVAYLVVSPCTLRNYSQFHKFIPVNIGLGFVLWPGNDLSADGNWVGLHYPPMWEVVKDQKTQIEVDEVLIEDALRNIKEHPLQILGLWPKKIRRFWMGKFWGEWDSTEFGELAASKPLLIKTWAFLETLIFLLFLLGVVLYRRRLPILLLICGYLTVVHVLTLGLYRYRMPLVPLELMVVAAALLKIYYLVTRKAV